MYTEPAHSEKNHKGSYCSDGAPVKAALERLVEPLVIDGVTMPFDAMPWPQPTGIFTYGNQFHPIPFLVHVRTMYQQLVKQQIPFEEADLEIQALGRIFQRQY